MNGSGMVEQVFKELVKAPTIKTSCVFISTSVLPSNAPSGRVPRTQFTQLWTNLNFLGHHYL